MSDEYIPCPIDTTGVELSEDLIELTERLAKHAHDLWALQRLRDGWQWGDCRSDALRTNPCLVEYEDLPDEEKVYDRRLAIGTIKAVIASGYTIIPPQSQSAERNGQPVHTSNKAASGE